MNFFKSIILDDPEPPNPETPPEPGSDSAVALPEMDRSPDAAAQGSNAAGWSFGTLVKTLATRSESVIETYSRDLMEFGTGLRKETEIIREAATRAVKDLPASLEAGTTAAHGVFDGVMKSTAEILSKETQVFALDGESETPEMNPSLISGRYSRFEAQLSGIQGDLNTFCEEPEDTEEYENWKSKFKLDEKRAEIDGLIGDSGALNGVFGNIVPNVVDYDTFWFRYFYRVDKLEQQEKVRADLVKRAISVEEDDDEYSWDVDDDDDDEKAPEKAKGGDGAEGEDANFDEKEGGNADRNDEVKTDLTECSERNVEESSALDKKEMTSDEKNSKNVGVDMDESVEKGDVSAASSHEVKRDEEDMGWDEIADIGSEDENKVSSSSHGGRRDREELRKQLNAAEDEEDLSWDVEDDDHPVKS